MRKRLGVPKDLHFKIQVELAWEMIQAAITHGIPFEVVGFDSLYGRSGWLRAQVRAALALYRAEVPVDTQVYLEKPVSLYPRAPLETGSSPREGTGQVPPAVQPRPAPVPLFLRPRFGRGIVGSRHSLPAAATTPPPLAQPVTPVAHRTAFAYAAGGLLGSVDDSACSWQIPPMD